MRFLYYIAQGLLDFRVVADELALRRIHLPGIGADADQLAADLADVGTDVAGLVCLGLFYRDPFLAEKSLPDEVSVEHLRQFHPGIPENFVVNICHYACNSDSRLAYVRREPLLCVKSA